MLTTLGESSKRLVYHLQHFLGPTKGNYKSHSFDLTSQKKILWALYNKINIQKDKKILYLDKQIARKLFPLVLF